MAAPTISRNLRMHSDIHLRVKSHGALGRLTLHGPPGRDSLTTGCRSLNDRFGSKCEDFRLSKSSPLHPTERTLVTCAATSLMGQKQTLPNVAKGTFAGGPI